MASHKRNPWRPLLVPLTCSDGSMVAEQLLENYKRPKKLMAERQGEQFIIYL